MVRNMMFRSGILLAVAAVLATPAAAVDLKPGLWELTGAVERDGRSMPRPSQSRCISAKAAQASRIDSAFIEDLGALRQLRARLGKDACKIVESQNAPALLTWRVVCKGAIIIEQLGSVRAADPKRFDMDVTTRITNGEKWVTSRVTAEGRYKGECPQ